VTLVVLLLAVAGVAACVISPMPSDRPASPASSSSPPVTRTSDPASLTAVPSPNSTPSPARADAITAVADWLATEPRAHLGRTLYIVTGVFPHPMGFDLRPIDELTEAERAAIAESLSGDYAVRFVDDPTPLAPSVRPDVGVSWSYPDDGSLIGFATAPGSTQERPRIAVFVDNGWRGTDAVLGLAWQEGGYEVTSAEVGEWVS
jgi:hypothetical protein